MTNTTFEKHLRDKLEKLVANYPTREALLWCLETDRHGDHYLYMGNDTGHVKFYKSMKQLEDVVYSREAELYCQWNAKLSSLQMDIVKKCPELHEWEKFTNRLTTPDNFVVNAVSLELLHDFMHERVKKSQLIGKKQAKK